MSIIIGTSESIDDYYKNQSSDNSWSALLDSMNKAYAQADYQYNQSYSSAITAAKTSAQNSLSSLYNSYRTSKATLGTGGYSEAYAAGVEKSAGSDLAANGLSAYNSALASNTPTYTPPSASQASDTVTTAYNAQTSALTSEVNGILDYFNVTSKGEDTGTTAGDTALSSGMINDSGALTAKGQAYLKYYLNQSSAATDSTDPYYTHASGTLKKYLQDKGITTSADNTSTLSNMFGIDLNNNVFSTDEKNSLTGTAITNVSKDESEIATAETMPTSSASLTFWDKIGRGLRNTFDAVSAIGEATKSRDQQKADTLASQSSSEFDTKQVTNYMKNKSEGWVKTSNGGIGGYVLNEDYTNKYIQLMTGKTDASISTLTLSTGLSVADALKTGVLDNGDTFTQDGLTYIINNGAVRMLYNESTQTAIEDRTQALMK